MSAQYTLKTPEALDTEHALIYKIGYNLEQVYGIPATSGNGYAEGPVDALDTKHELLFKICRILATNP